MEILRLSGKSESVFPEAIYPVQFVICQKVSSRLSSCLLALNSSDYTDFLFILIVGLDFDHLARILLLIVLDWAESR